MRSAAISCSCLVLLALLVQCALCVPVYLDTHAHAVYTKGADDSDTYWTPDDAKDWHVANGYNAMIITNHMPDEYLAPTVFDMLSTPTFAVLPGREYALKNMHIVLVFDPVTYPQLYGELPKLVGVNPFDYCYDQDQLFGAIQEWHSLGALVVYAHPHLRENPCPYQPSWAMYKRLGFDFVERITSGLWDFKNQAEEDAAGIRVLAGSDGHNKLKTVPGGYTRMDVPQLTPSMIYEELVNGTVWVELDFARASQEYLLVLMVLLPIMFVMIIALIAIKCWLVYYRSHYAQNPVVAPK